MNMQLNTMNTLPTDGQQGCLIGRVWRADKNKPVPVLLKNNEVMDISSHFSTIAQLLENASPVSILTNLTGEVLGTIDELLDNTHCNAIENDKFYFLSPIDLQVIKAAGVTFASSMLERVIEEKAGGDAAKAKDIRNMVTEVIGNNLKDIVPGSEQAQKLKEHLINHNMWSQYLEVGIGVDAEIFTKAATLSSVGVGQYIGINTKSEWNNPEPEIVLVVNSVGKIQGATLGNDVNLRDFEGRSALLLSKAKDNNASCALGPFIRLFDENFSLDDIRQCNVELEIEGSEGYILTGESSMTEISRDPEDLVQQTLNENHQYPDGFVLFLGTLFAPTQDRDKVGAGFTHKINDIVKIHTPKLGTLQNIVTTSDKAPQWNFGLLSLIDSLKN